MHFIWILCTMAVVSGVNTVSVYQPDRVRAKMLMHREVTHVLQGLSLFRQHLQQQGLINSIDVDHTTDFDEVETLQLIPLIIEQVQTSAISSEDTHNLQRLFGSMWPLIENEARRRNEHESSDSIDPLLKSILRALVFSHHIKNPQQLLAQPTRGVASKLARRDKRDGLVEPAQRLLKMAAVLINEQMLRSTSRAMKRSFRKQSAVNAYKMAVKQWFELQRHQEPAVRVTMQ